MISCNGLQQYKRSVGKGLLCTFVSKLFSPAALSDLEKDPATVENGHKEPCLNHMAKLGKAFGLNLSQLLQDIDA